MVIAADTSVFDKIKTFKDYQQADQAFQMQKALQQQALQTGGIDAASKANIYATQVLSAATATGDQSAYDNARQHLAQNGIDVSTWAPDVKTGAQQAQAARLAQSPLGSLFSAQQKVIGNNIAATGAMGSTDAAAQAGFIQPVPTINPITGAVTVTPQAAPQPALQPKPMPAASNSKPTMLDAFPDVITDNTVSPQQPANNAPAQPVVLNTPAAPASGKFSFRPQSPGETMQAYKAAQDAAFEQYKADPNYIASQKKAEKQGEFAATNEENARHSQEMTQRLNQNLDALEKLVPDLPTSNLVDPATKAYIGKRNPFDDKKAATAYSQFQEINQQQMINGLSELVKSGQIRGNQFIEKIISRGYMINPDDPKEAQIADIKNLKAELANINTSAQNIAGGNNQYQQIPVVTSQPAIPKMGATMQGTDGTYLFNGGDPADKNNWKKVK